MNSRNGAEEGKISNGRKSLFQQNRPIQTCSWTFPIEVPRRCNFVVTANRKSLLNDSTGSRRYWALVCGQVVHPGDGWKKLPVAELEKIVVQIWLEARYLYPKMFNTGYQILKTNNARMPILSLHLPIHGYTKSETSFYLVMK